MRVGLNSPVVTAFPGATAAWEHEGTVDQLAQVAATADRVGLDHLTCSEHVAVPADLAEERGGTYWDPLATLSYLAAHTHRIRLTTQVLVLPYHHPLEIAKRYGTLDLISGGRVVLGVGVGSLTGEFELLDAEWADRGAVTDDAMGALKAALGREKPAYDGPHFSFSEMVVSPHAPRTDVPLWVGGRTPRSLRRAVERGDGWVPFGLRTDDMTRMLAQVRDGAGVPEGFEVVLGTGRAVDPGEEPAATRERLERLRGAGATVVSATLVARSARHYVEQVEALAEVAAED